MHVEVAFATSTKQIIVSVMVGKNSTILEVIQQSGILTLFPEIDLTQAKIGIFSNPCQLTDPIKAGDRVEIYRPLRIDPKEARRAKAKKRLKNMG